MTDRFHRFKGDIQLKDGSMKGSYFPEPFIRCEYSLNLQPPGSKYLVRGTVKLMDPSDPGSVLMARVSEDKKEKVAQVISINIFSTEAKDLRDAIAQKSQILVSRNAVKLNNLVGETETTDHLHFSLLFNLYADTYAGEKSTSSDTRKRRKNRLEKVSGELGDCRLCDLSESELKKAKKNLGKSWESYFIEARDFLDFVVSRRRDVLEDFKNVFREYFVLHPKEKKKKRSSEKSIKEATTSDILTYAEQKRLHDEGMENIKNGELFGVNMFMETGLSAPIVSELKCGQVIWIDRKQHLAILDYRVEKNAGAVHNYSFPLFLSAGRLIDKRFAYLEQLGYKGQQFSDLPLVSCADDPEKKLGSAELTAKCRYFLRTYGTGYAKLARMEGATEGGGITLLKKTYENRLLDCGFGKDSGLFKFMMHKSLVNMVQANNYRCFTDQTAIHKIQTMLRRDERRYASKARRKKLVVSKEKGNTYLHQINSFSPNCCAGAGLTVRLKKGERIEIEAKYGCEVSFRTEVPKKE